MAARANHPAEMAGLYAVVRTVLDACLADRVPVAPAVVAAAALVARWLDGGAATAAALGQARDRTQAASDRAVKVIMEIGGSAQWKEREAEKQSLKRAEWVATAVGNLCHKALKERGWQELASVMDAAAYSTPALDSDALEAIRRRAVAAFGAGPAAAQVKAPPSGKARPVRVDAKQFAPRLGALLAARLKSLGGMIDGDARAEGAALRALIVAKGYVASKAVLAFDAAYGGLTIAEDDDDWIIGAAACCCSDAHAHPVGGRGKLVPVAYAPNDIIWFLDDKGRGFAEDSIADPKPLPFASSGDQLVAKIVARLSMLLGRSQVLDGSHGAAIAAALKIAKVAPASDAHSTLWSDGKRWVLEDATTTTVCGVASGMVKKILRR